MTEESNLIVIKGTFNKTPGLEYKIQPCPKPNGQLPSCVRKVDSKGDMILTDADVKYMNEGGVLLPETDPIIVQHGTTFDLTNPLQKAQWEAIENSRMIAKERDERDINGELAIDGGKSIVDKYLNPRGRYGLAELYIERQGRTAQMKINIVKKIHEAESLILDDSLQHQIMICKLFEKDMSHSHSADVTDYLLTQAQKYPEKVIKFYNAEESTVRLLLIVARERGIVATKPEGLYYSEIKLGSNLDIAVDYLRNNPDLKKAIQQETYPELEVKKTKK